MRDFGGMVSFLLESEEEAVAMVARTNVWTLAESLGGVESLIEHPFRMTHAATATGPFASPRNLVRLSVGIESAHDLVADLEQALTPAQVRGVMPSLTRTAVPYAQISVHVDPSSDVSNRIARTAFAPIASASATSRSIACSRPCASILVIPASSPPTSDFREAPIWEPMLRERTVRPNTSPTTSWIS